MVIVIIVIILYLYGVIHEAVMRESVQRVLKGNVFRYYL